MDTRRLSALMLGVSVFSTPGVAQDAARDRAELDAAAGRRAFENVLLSDPQAFAPRSRARASARPPEPLAATGEAAADREQLDMAAGRAVYRSNVAGTLARPTPATAEAQSGRPLRVILASPYGR